MADEEVGIIVIAHSIGEEVYARHVAGIGRVADAHEEAGESVERMAGRFDGARAALSGLNLALLSAARGMRFFGVANDVVTKAIDGLVTVLTMVRSALAIHTAQTEAATAANWQLAVAKAAGQGLGAVVIAAAIVASVGALLAYQSGVMKFAAGGSALLTGPTLILAGEAGPELATFTPGTGAPLATMTRTIEHTIIESDPQEAARKAVEYILSLTQPGR